MPDHRGQWQRAIMEWLQAETAAAVAAGGFPAECARTLGVAYEFPNLAPRTVVERGAISRALRALAARGMVERNTIGSGAVRARTTHVRLIERT